MSIENRDIDGLLRRNTERQLRDFDWGRLRETVLARVTATRAREGRSGGPWSKAITGAAVGVAAVLMLAAGYLCISRFPAVKPGAIRPSETPAAGGSAAGDGLLASSDPETILLTGPARLLAANDPLLSPHSVWDQ